MSTIKPKAGKCSKGTKAVTFKHPKKTTVCMRAKGGGKKKRKAPGGKRCRAGGAGWKAELRKRMAKLPAKPTKAQRRKAFEPAMFVSCK